MVVLIVVTILLIAGGIWYYESQQPHSPSTSVNSTTNSSSQAVDTSGWPTYQNALYGYAISYPSDATIQYDTYEQPGGFPVIAPAPAKANEIIISINTSTYPDVLADAEVDVLPSEDYVGATGLGIGDKIVSSIFILDGSAYTAKGVDGSADDGSIFMAARVGKLEIGYRFSPADIKPMGDPEFSEVQNELLAIIKTFHFTTSSQESELFK